MRRRMIISLWPISMSVLRSVSKAALRNTKAISLRAPPLAGGPFDAVFVPRRLLYHLTELMKP